MDISDVVPHHDALILVPPQLAKRFRCVPTAIEEQKLVVAMVNPLDVFIIDELRLTTGLEIEPMIAIEEDLALCGIYPGDVQFAAGPNRRHGGMRDGVILGIVDE